MFRRGRKKKKAEQTQLEAAAGNPPQPAAENLPQPAAEMKPVQTAGNGEAAANDSSALESHPVYDAKDARKMRSALQKAIKRPVILPNERLFDVTKRKVLENRRAILGLGVVGTGIAAVATAGAAAAALAICAAALPVLDFPTFFDTGVLDPNLSVTLKQDAVALLLKESPEEQAKKVQAAIHRIRGAGPDGRLTLSAKDIEPVSSPPHRALDIAIGPVRVGVRMGLAVVGAGLLLLALTIIPQDIHALMARVASAILVVGALIVGAAVANSSWLKGVERIGYHAHPDPD